MTKNILLVGAALILFILAAGCGQITPSGPNPATARAMTLYAVLTESAHNLNNPSPTIANTAVPVIPTGTPTSVATATSAVTILPSVTPTSSQLATPCYRAHFVKDVTIADYTVINPGDTFIKTWRLTNNGSCDWAADTSIGFFSGTQMGGPSSQSLGQIVAVGDQIDISLTLKAPTDPGTYTGYWMLLTPSGGRFGIGDAGDLSFYVLIVVKSSTTTPTLSATAGTPSNTSTPTTTRSPTPVPTSTRTRTPLVTSTPTPTATCRYGYRPPNC
ncbi:MAG: NBR1-Ig-like domain-containing protein [Anaerolineales bacterium]